MYEEGAFEYPDTQDDEGSFKTFEPDISFQEPPCKKQKMDDSIFKNISEKFNPKKIVDSEINGDLAQFVNNTFQDGISDEGQAEILKDICHPSNCDALIKTKVNQSIWRLLKPHTQTDDVKMQSIQNNIIKA